jgi:hypothetical protein
MMADASELIDGYFDDDLSPEQQKLLSDWIKYAPEHARLFAQAALLHDRLRNTMMATDDSQCDFGAPERNKVPQSRFRDFWLTNSLGKTSAAAALLVAGLLTLWFSVGTPRASAAIRELDRIIVSSLQWKDRAYEIVVEDVTPERRGKQPAGPESQRPPKPPLDGAKLYVRAGNQFVLIRKTEEGLPFVTGSNGQQSWAVNTRGPVRVSSDIHRFDHDLPGHETSVPLTNLHEGLQQLKRSYDLTFSSLGPEEYQPEDGHEARLLVALKKPRDRGPQRVEIVYDSTTGRILRMRFVQMPYGPDRLDLRLSLVSEEELPTNFFEHATHHAPNRKIETEN